MGETKWVNAYEEERRLRRLAIETKSPRRTTKPAGKTFAIPKELINTLTVKKVFN